MKPDNFEISRIIAESILGELPDSDVAKLNAWRDESPEHEKLFNTITNEKLLEKGYQLQKSFDRKQGWDNYRRKQSQKTKRKIYLRIARYAAVLVLPLTLALYLLLQNTSGNSEMNNTTNTSGVQLTLADGRVVDLDTYQGEIATGAEQLQIENRDNKLCYNDTSKVNNEAEAYNEIFVPKCAEYRLKLSDGTEVHMNSMSRLRFPVRFSKKTREIQLEGEAYFSVKKDAHKPFIVHTSKLNVTVLGTEFNVSAYKDDALVSTTLVKGSVAVDCQGLNKQLILKPNDHLEFNNVNSSIKVSQVDVNYYISWKDGKARFDDARLEDIMRVVARWYDIDSVEIDDDVKNLRFRLNIDRQPTIDPIIHIFKLNGKINIKLEDRVLKVEKN